MKRIVISIVIVGTLCSCTPTNTPENAVNGLNETVHRLMDLWQTGDTLKTGEIFLEDCVYVDKANNYTFRGISGVNRYVHHIHTWASEVKMEIRDIKASDVMGFVEWTMTAKQTRPIGGRVPVATNNDITLNGVTLIDFRDGKISKATDYMDVLAFVMQLGARVELPGGVTLGE